MKVNSYIVLLMASYLVILFLVIPSHTQTRVLSPLHIQHETINRQLEEEKFAFRFSEAIAYLDKISAKNSIEYHIRKLRSPKTEHLLLIMTNSMHHVENGKLNLAPLAVSVDEIVRNNDGYAMLICDEKNNSETSHIKAFPKIKIDISKDSTNIFDTRKKFLGSCIEKCLEKVLNNVHTVTVFSLNVLPYANFGPDLKYILHNKLNNHLVSGELEPNSDNWLFLHLQEPVPFRSFQFDFSSFLELISIISIGSALFYVLSNSSNSLRVSSSTSVFTTCYGGVLFLTLALALGRPYLNEMRRICPALYKLYDPPESIDFSAMSFPVENLKDITTHFWNNTCTSRYPIHRFLDDFINTFEKPGYVISPSLVRYV